MCTQIYIYIYIYTYLFIYTYVYQSIASPCTGLKLSEVSIPGAGTYLQAVSEMGSVVEFTAAFTRRREEATARCVPKLPKGAYAFVCVFICYTYMYMYICVCIYMYTYVCIRIGIHTFGDAFVHRCVLST